MLCKKRGYFFILDAMLGLFIIIIGVFVISSYYVEVKELTQVSLLADDFLNFLSITKIRDFNNPYTGLGGILWNNKTITNQDNSLLQQIGELYSLNNLNIAEKIIENVSVGIIPPQFRYELLVDEVLIYPLSPAQEHLTSKSNTKLLLTSKMITFGIINKTTSNIWGPYKVEIFLWET